MLLESRLNILSLCYINICSQHLNTNKNGLRRIRERKTQKCIYTYILCHTSKTSLLAYTKTETNTQWAKHKKSKNLVCTYCALLIRRTNHRVVKNHRDKNHQSKCKSRYPHKNMFVCVFLNIGQKIPWRRFVFCWCAFKNRVFWYSNGGGKTRQVRHRHTQEKYWWCESDKYRQWDGVRCASVTCKKVRKICSQYIGIFCLIVCMFGVYIYMYLFWGRGLLPVRLVRHVCVNIWRVAPIKNV